ncbi:MAG: helix-turn-helix transcriptional regulator [Fibrobacter sp.]|nr:helix-turn-helix transcriptional regulator [Fibrobacter sp.]
MGMDFKDSAVFTAAFQKLLIDVRRHTFVTQTQLSKSAGLTRQSISLMECGKRVASFQTFCILAQGLGISPVDLMCRFVRICEAESFARHGKVATRGEAVDGIVNLRALSSEQNNIV